MSKRKNRPLCYFANAGSIYCFLPVVKCSIPRRRHGAIAGRLVRFFKMRSSLRGERARSAADIVGRHIIVGGDHSQAATPPLPLCSPAGACAGCRSCAHNPFARCPPRASRLRFRLAPDARPAARHPLPDVQLRALLGSAEFGGELAD